MNDPFFFTTESVFEGHPDKAADQIADALLDRYLAEDPYSKVACEVLLSQDLLVLAGEVTSKASFDKMQIVEEQLEEMGYLNALAKLRKGELNYICRLHDQAPTLRTTVEAGAAGDQGLMFGFACSETEELMPLGTSLCQKIVLHFAALRRKFPFLGSDGKTQITLEYESPLHLKRIHSVVLSSQHTEEISLPELRSFIKKELLPLLPSLLVDDNTLFYINPSGSFLEGGMDADTGLTGRKIIVDTYGGYARHGGGSFSGKDPSKLDRTGAYSARHIAKNLVHAGLAKKVELQLSYCIGMKEPTSLFIETFGTSPHSQKALQEIVRKNFPLTPESIIEALDLRKPRFKRTAFGGHFGRTGPEFTWEKTVNLK